MVFISDIIGREKLDEVVEMVLRSPWHIIDDLMSSLLTTKRNRTRIQAIVLPYDSEVLVYSCRIRHDDSSSAIGRLNKVVEESRDITKIRVDESVFEALRDDSAYNLYPFDEEAGLYLRRCELPEGAQRRESKQFFCMGIAEFGTLRGCWVNKMVYTPDPERYRIKSKSKLTWD
ncbi:hypothetical protein D6745_01550 [Candidatus Woesearchaeota archaeon]|nr:MAG: hypothetical protein D6745_01550 [Candidatus Woesearchaeota archaeon]